MAQTLPKWGGFVNIDETRALCLWLIKLIPTQQFDDDTPETWQPILAKVDIADARNVILEIIEREQYVAPRDIAQSVKRLRRDRLARVGFAELTPNVAPLLELDDGRVVENPAHRAEKLALRDKIASGVMAEDEVAAYARGEVATLTGAPAAVTAGALVSRQMPELRGVTRRPEPG